MMTNHQKRDEYTDVDLDQFFQQGMTHELLSEIAPFTPNMIADEFDQMIDSLNYLQLVTIFFRCINVQNIAVHMLILIHHKMGSDLLAKLLRRIADGNITVLSQELMKMTGEGIPLYHALLRGSHHHRGIKHLNNVFQSELIGWIREKITNLNRTTLILQLFHSLSWAAILKLLSQMSAPDRLQLLQVRMPDREQNTVIEKIAIENPDSLLKLLEMDRDQKECCEILTVLFKYTDNSPSAASDPFNWALTRLGNAVPQFSMFTGELKRGIDSLKSTPDVYEMMLMRIIRRNRSLLSRLPKILSMTPSFRLTILFQACDVRGIPLYAYLAACTSMNETIHLLARAEFAVSEEHRMFDPTWIDLIRMREVLNGLDHLEEAIGFQGLLIIYNYIAVRSTEGNPDDYRNSLLEFTRMLNVLHVNCSSQAIKAQLKKHCDENPLRQRWVIPLAVTHVQLGSCRHHDARATLNKLTVQELKAGIKCFRLFIGMRMMMKPEKNSINMDDELMMAFKSEREEMTLAGSMI